MSTLVRRRPWTGGPRFSRHLEAETRPAWSSHLYQAVLGEQQGKFPDSFIVLLFATTPEIILSVMFFFESSRDFSLRGSRSPRRHSGLPWWLSDKESTCNAGDAGDMGLIPGSGRSPGGGHGNPLQYSCLENPLDRESLAGYNPWGGKQSDTTKHARLHTHILAKCSPLAHS